MFSDRWNSEVVLLSQENIDDDGLNEVVDFILETEGDSHPRALDLSHNSFSSTAVVSLSQALLSSLMVEQLVELDLSDNTIGNDGASSLAELLSYPNSALCLLRLERSCIGVSGAVSLACALTVNIHTIRLQALHLSGNPIGDAGATAIVSALRNVPSLTELALAYCNIGDSTLAQLVQVLQSASSNSTSTTSSSTSLSLLSSSSTSASSTPTSMSSLSSPRPSSSSASAPVVHRKYLAALDLRGNKFTDIGVSALAQALADNSALKTLKLDENSSVSSQSDGKAYQALVTAFQSNETLTEYSGVAANEFDKIRSSSSSSSSTASTSIPTSATASQAPAANQSMPSPTSSQPPQVFSPSSSFQSPPKIQPIPTPQRHQAPPNPLLFQSLHHQSNLTPRTPRTPRTPDLQSHPNPHPHSSPPLHPLSSTHHPLHQLPVDQNQQQAQHHHHTPRLRALSSASPLPFESDLVYRRPALIVADSSTSILSHSPLPSPSSSNSNSATSTPRFYTPRFFFSSSSTRSSSPATTVTVLQHELRISLADNERLKADLAHVMMQNERVDHELQVTCEQLNANQANVDDIRRHHAAVVSQLTLQVEMARQQEFLARRELDDARMRGEQAEVQFKVQNDELQQQHAAAQREIQRQADMNQSLSSELESVRNELQSSRQRQASTLEQLHQTQQKLDQLGEQYQQLMNDNDEWQVKYEAAAEAQSGLTRLATDVSHARAQLRLADDRFLSLQREVDSTRQQLRDALSQSQSFESECITLKSTSSLTQRNVETLQFQLEECQRARTVAEQQQSIYQQQVTDMQWHMERVKSQALTAAETARGREVQLNSDMQKLRHEIASLQAELNDTKQAASSWERQYHQQRAERSEADEAFGARLCKYGQRELELQNEVQQTCETLKFTETQLEIARSRLDGLNQQLQVERDDFERRLADARAQTDAVKRELVPLQLKLQPIDEQMTQWNVRLLEREKRCSQLQTEMTVLKSQIVVNQKQHAQEQRVMKTDYERRLSLLEDERMLVSRRRDELDSELSALKLSSHEREVELQNQIASLQRSVESLQSQFVAADVEVKSLSNQLLSSHQVRLELETNLQRLQQELSASLSESADLKSQLAWSQQAFEHQQKEFEERESKLNEQLNFEQQTVSSQRQTFQQLESQISSLQLQISELNQQIFEFKIQQKESEQRESKLNEQLTSEQHTVSTQQQIIQQLESQLLSLQLQISELNQQNDELKQEAVEAAASHQQREQSLQSRIDEGEVKLADLHQQHAELQLILSSSQQNLQRQTARVDQLQSEIDGLLLHRLQSEGQIASLHTQLDQQTALTQQLQLELDQIQPVHLQLSVIPGPEVGITLSVHALNDEVLAWQAQAGLFQTQLMKSDGELKASLNTLSSTLAELEQASAMIQSRDQQIQSAQLDLKSALDHLQDVAARADNLHQQLTELQTRQESDRQQYREFVQSFAERVLEDEVHRLHAEQTSIYQQLQQALARWIDEQEQRLQSEQEAFRTHVQQFAADKFAEYETELHRDVAHELEAFQIEYRQQVRGEQAEQLSEILTAAANRYEQVCAKLDEVTRERDRLVSANRVGFW